MFWKTRSYFDYASTTPLDKRVFKAMKPYLGDKYANPSSLYKEAVEVAKAVTEARKKVAGVLQSKPEDIIFTAGGTESNNLAILGTFYYQKNVLRNERQHYVTTSIEHSSVLEVFEYIRSLGARVTYVSPEENGIVSPKKIAEAIIPETVLVSVMYVNNEIGTIQPIRDIGKMLRAKNEALENKDRAVIFHVDACQGASYLPLLINDLQVDLLTLDGSKIYGPKGTGILFKRSSGKKVNIMPIVHGGKQENGLRSGTENVAGIVGFAEALQLAQKERIEEGKKLSVMRDRLLGEILHKVKNIRINGDREKRLPNNINICQPGLDAEYAVLRLDALGFAVSSVTSCKSLSEDSSSYVIEELYNDESCSRSSLRITLGRFTTNREINKLAAALLIILNR